MQRGCTTAERKAKVRRASFMFVVCIIKRINNIQNVINNINNHRQVDKNSNNTLSSENESSQKDFISLIIYSKIRTIFSLGEESNII